MRTWLIIYKEKGEIKSRIIMAKGFIDVIADVCECLALGDVKGIFEVAR